MVSPSVVFKAIRACCATVLVGLALSAPRPALADPLRADLSFNTSGGYGRLILRFSQEVDAQVRISGTILVISFPEPVDVSIDRLNLNDTDYIGAARRDPDGKAIRIALARKVTLSQMTAAEQFVALYKGLGGGWEEYQSIPPIRQPQPAVVAAFRRVLAPEDPLK